MPMLHSMAHDMCCAANNVAQSALINQCARLLMRARMTGGDDGAN